MEPMEAEAMRWLAGSLRWEHTMSQLRDEREPDDADAAPEPVADGREPVPFRRLPVPVPDEERVLGDRVA